VRDSERYRSPTTERYCRSQRSLEMTASCLRRRIPCPNLDWKCISVDTRVSFHLVAKLGANAFFYRTDGNGHFRPVCIGKLEMS
jgi:hypothetical protein